MAEFIIRARSAPVDASVFRQAAGGGLGVEYLADIVRSALFISQGHREDVKLHLVLEKSRDFSRVLTFSGESLGSLRDLHEGTLLEAIAVALEAGAGMGRDQTTESSQGVIVRTQSFEHLVRDMAETRELYLLDKRGDDVRSLNLSDNMVFVMTDHTPMPKNTYKSMARQGVKQLSLGPVMLHAAQCITIIHNELDRID